MSMPRSVRAGAGAIAGLFILTAGVGASAQAPSGIGGQIQGPDTEIMRDLVRGEPDHTVVIVGQGEGVTYTIETNGGLEAVDGELDGYNVSVQDNDVVEGGRASGRVTGGNDGYRVWGEIESISLDPEGEAEIRVDGDPYRRLRAVTMDAAPMTAQSVMPAAPEEDATESDGSSRGELRLADSVTSVSPRAGAGQIDNTLRRDLYPFVLTSARMREQGDRPCYIRLFASNLRGPGAPGFRDTSVTVEPRQCEGGPRNTSTEQVELPDRHAVVSVGVCLNHTRTNARVKGLELRGWRIDEYMDPDADHAGLMARDRFERTNCSTWEYTSCPREQVATGMVLTRRVRTPALADDRTWINGVRLICRRVESY